MLHGFDFDITMLRTAAMNLLLHGVEHPGIHYQDTLAKSFSKGDFHGYAANRFDVVLANPPFTGSIDLDTLDPVLHGQVKTKKTELLFVVRILKMLRVGGRAAVIVPEGVLFGSSKAHKALRQMLVEEHQLDAVVSLPSGVFKPYAGVSTAILVFTRTDGGGAENVWFYKVEADGFSLDDRRNAQLPPEKLGPDAKLAKEEHEKNNLPDIVARWNERKAEAKRPRTAQSFLVPKKKIKANAYDLSVNRYREVEYEEVKTDPPKKIITDLMKLETEIQKGLKELEGMLG
jgi:type I restriction enzyme M protein